MHIAEGVLPASHAAITWAMAVPPIVWSSRWLHADAPDARRHRLTPRPLCPSRFPWLA